MTNNYAFKRIADPVHKTVGLNQLETKIISTRAFQRLRYVKHLGLAHLVFPGADYSRLSHCIGVCHVTGRILESLKANSSVQITDEEYTKYRLAGLLHDIGHYPFSHAFEDAVKQFYGSRISETALDDSAGSKSTQQTDEGYLEHEDVGEHLLTNDDEIQEIMDCHSVEPRAIYSIFTREDPPRFANLISSELDADRIDYMLRTSLHTGLPYGSVDIEYILSQTVLDSKNRICLTPKALHAAEHFILGRHFDYQSVSFHKTVAASELVLKDAITYLISHDKFDCSSSGVKQMITSGKWYEFDDSLVMQSIREAIPDTGGSDLIKMESLSKRRPPKLIGSVEFMGARDNLDQHRLVVRDLNRICEELSSEFSIDRRLWYVWDSGGRSLTKVSSHVPISASPFDYEQDELQQGIRIQDGSDSKPIVNVKRSLMSILAQQTSYCSRLYVLLPDGRESDRAEITKRASRKIDHGDWIDG